MGTTGQIDGGADGLAPRLGIICGCQDVLQIHRYLQSSTSAH
jgi:hypothetical protein